MMKKVLTYSLTLAFLTACNKETVTPPQQSMDEPAFTASISLDGISQDFVAGEDNCVLRTSTNKSHAVYHSNSVFTKGNDTLLLRFNDGILQNNTPFISKWNLTMSDGAKFASFKSHFLAESIQQLLGENVDLYIDNVSVPTGTYVFPTSGVYMVKAYKNINNEMYVIENECFVGFKNPFGNLIFQYNPNTQQLMAEIVNSDIGITSVHWFLGNEQVGENKILALTESPTGVKKLRAIVVYNQGITKEVEGLIDFAQASNSIPDIKQYSHLFHQENNSDDLRVAVQFSHDNQTWEVSSENTEKLSVTKIEFYKKIDGKNIYLVEGEATNVLFENKNTGAKKIGNVKIRTGIEVPY